MSETYVSVYRPHRGLSPTSLPATVAEMPARTPGLVGVAWALLSVNVLGFYAKPDMVIPIPKPVAQMITMGALMAAFGLALVLNPRVRLRPSSYLLLLSLLAVVSIASSMQLESGFGALFRCFRLVMFVLTLWLLSGWWRSDLRFAIFHLYALAGVLLSIVLGIAIAPGPAFSGPGGRLVGAIWPIPAPQVGLYCAVAAGLAIMLWLGRAIDGRSAAVIAVPAIGLLLFSHTRTALIGLIAALVLAGLSLAFTNVRARRTLGVAIGLGIVAAVVFGKVIMGFLTRGQATAELTSLTGRARVWDALLAQDRTLGEQIFGIGLTDKTFNGLPIDNTWLSIYNDQGWLGVVIVAAILVALIVTAALRPPSPARACAVFLVAYCCVASYTEVGLGDASPYMLTLAAAASLLAAGGTPPGQRIPPTVSTGVAPSTPRGRHRS